MTVNLDVWNALPEEDRQAIEGVVETLEAEFWAQSAAEDDGKTEILVENGITVTEAEASMKAVMSQAGQEMWDAFVERVPAAGPIIEQYTAEAGK
nr:hypothetical protein [Marinicella sp. W31]MDC2879739.1 hypothetical protein [Marinicella sp. W31]